MRIKIKEIEKFKVLLHEWKGGGVAFNSFRDDHDRLTLKLTHPFECRSVGLTLFYCDYLAGPISWKNSALEPSICALQDGTDGIELKDEAVGFTVRCANASLFGVPEFVIPSS